MEMTYANGKSTETIVYIEYQNGKVFDVTTADIEKGYIRGHYDFEEDCKGIYDYMYYNSGSGGSIKELCLPNYIHAGVATYWLHPLAALKDEGTNLVRLAKPLMLKEGSNPFDNGREVYSTTYCKVCDKYYDEDLCDEHHIYDSKTGELRYADGTKKDY